MEQQQITAYEALGGEAGLHRLVDRFYFYMDTLPEAAIVRAMHDDDLSVSNDKLFSFLSGRFGGPNLYIEKYGHPRLRMRHLPFAIGKEDADVWVLCMDKALDECVPDADVRNIFHTFFAQVAENMRNQAD